MEEKSLRKYSLVGFPDEIGVKNVNGRLGTAGGPAAFMEAFQKVNGAVLVKERCREVSVISMGSDLEANYHQTTEKLSQILRANPSDVLVGVGGGHDYAYPWLKALEQNQKKPKKLGCINLDAHFDLRPCRPVMTSGSPFRRLIEEGILDPKNLIEFGIQEHCNSADLYEFVRKSKIKTIPFASLRNGKAVATFKSSLATLRKSCSEIAISLDLDSLAFAFAPGVSAPQAEGFTGSEIFQMLEIAGGDKKVTSLGIFELSPPLDVQNLTSRLAAQAAWHFLSKKLN